MRIKIGDVWHTSGPENPFMIIFKPEELEHIRGMGDTETLYAVDADHHLRSRQDFQKWMNDGRDVAE